jgi:type VI secretion system secreted protein VgrG
MADDDDRRGIHLGFFSKAMKSDDRPLSLLGLDGREELSRLFEIDLLLARTGEPLDAKLTTALLQDPCVIAIGTQKSDIIHGYLASIEHVAGSKEASYYRARLVPVTALMALGRRSAIYEDTNVADMVTKILLSYGMKKGKDFEIHTSNAAKSPKHEYIVQYKESDWSFIQRWLEHEGYFYWFKHGAKGVELVIADANADLTRIEDPHAIAFRDKSNLTAGGLPTIWSFHAREQRVEESLTLVDYNYRRPLDMLLATKPIDKAGFGTVFEYGDHYKDKGTGGELAKIRAEEILAHKRVAAGATDCERFRVGHTFELENHYFPAYDGKYLLTSVEHSGGVPVASVGEDFAGDAGEARPYRARFTAIPFDVQFRPKRSTPWPRIGGVMNAHIEADTSGDYAQIDDKGRYKVKLTFDVETHKGLASSRWIRMAQSYAGASYGQHFPLHKGTEVLLVHVDGDPDRPIIAGAVPNEVTPSPVFSANASQSVLQTASGIRIELEDLQK